MSFSFRFLLHWRINFPYFLAGNRDEGEKIVNLSKEITCKQKKKKTITYTLHCCNKRGKIFQQKNQQKCEQILQQKTLFHLITKKKCSIHNGNKDKNFWAKIH